MKNIFLLLFMSFLLINGLAAQHQPSPKEQSYVLVFGQDSSIERVRTLTYDFGPDILHYRIGDSSNIPVKIPFDAVRTIHCDSPAIVYYPRRFDTLHRSTGHMAIPFDEYFGYLEKSSEHELALFNRTDLQLEDFFEIGSNTARMSAHGQNQMASLAQMMKKHKAYIFLGTSLMGTEYGNEDFRHLAKSRALELQQQLMNLGVPQEQILIGSLGSHLPKQHGVLSIRVFNTFRAAIIWHHLPKERISNYKCLNPKLNGKD